MEQQHAEPNGSPSRTERKRGPAPAAIAPATPPDVPLIMPPPSGPARVTPAYAAADAERVAKFPAEPWCLPPDHARPPLPMLPLLTEQRQPVQALPEQRMSELWQIRTPKPPQKVHQKTTNNRHQAAPRRRLENQGAHLPGERRVEARGVVSCSGMSVPPAAQEETDRWKRGDYL